MEPKDIKIGMSVYHTGNRSANIIISKDIVYRQTTGHYLVRVIAQNGFIYEAYIDLLVPYDSNEHRALSNQF